MQEEVTRKTIALAIKTAKLDGKVLQAALRKLLQLYSKARDTPHRGKQTLKQLMRHGTGVSNIEITDANIKAFESTAKKYGIDFALKKADDRYLVFFKGRDADVLTAAFREFSKKKLDKERKPSVRRDLAEKKAEAAQTAKRDNIDCTFHGERDSYEGRQDFGDGDGALIDHIQAYHEYYAKDENWKNFVLHNEGAEAWEKDKAERETLLTEFVPYMRLHCNLSEQERTAADMLENGEALTPEQTAYFHAVLAHVDACREKLNAGDYHLPDPPQLSDFDKELQDYKAHVESEIAQEAEAAGMTVEEYAANGYEPQEQPTDVQEQPEEAPPADTAPEQTAVRYYTINEGAARRANDANSYRDYAAGSATAEYRQMVDQAAAIAQRQKERVDPMYHEKIDALLDTYARKLAENLNDHYAIEARVPSILVAGGSNFPVRKKEKQNAARDRNMQEWQDVQGILDKIRSTGMGGISMDDPQAAAKLEAKLVKLESAQETMKAELAIQTALRTDNNRLIYENGSRELPKECRFEATPDREYGKFVRYEAVPHDPDALRELLRDESRKRERLKPGNFREHIGRLSDEKVLAEAQRLSAAFQSLQAPNSPNGTHFVTEVSPWFERIASSKEHERLFALLPYKTLYLSSVKDRHGVFAFINKDERRDLPLRKQRPSVRAQLKEGQSKKTAAPKKAAAKAKDNDLEV